MGVTGLGIRILGKAHRSCVISDKVLDLSELLFPHLQNRGLGSPW